MTAAIAHVRDALASNQIPPRFTLDMSNFFETSSGQTVGCLAGLTTIMLSPDVEYVEDQGYTFLGDPCPAPHLVRAAATDLLGLSTTDAQDLFCPPSLANMLWGDVTPLHLASVLTHYLDTGVVDWSAVAAELDN